MWQNYWECLDVYPSKTYTIPIGAVCTCFIRELAQLLDDTVKQKCNSEKFIVFQMVILKRVSGVNHFLDIKITIGQLMDDWAAGKFKVLVETTLGHMKASLTRARGSTSAKQRAKVFHGKML
jgi:hypothetical protein